jgi:hypothetical protein
MQEEASDEIPRNYAHKEEFLSENHRRDRKKPET